MSAPVIFYMFLNMFGMVVINDAYLTTLVFDEPVGRIHSGATGKELYIKKSPDSKMVFIKSKGKALLTNVNIPTQNGKLYSFLLRTGKRPHSIIQIKDGKKSSLFKQVTRFDKYLIEESDYTLRLTNKSRSPLDVNTITISPKQAYEFPKGSPLFINNKRVLR